MPLANHSPRSDFFRKLFSRAEILSTRIRHDVGATPARMIGVVGQGDPSAFSMVTPNAFAGTPTGNFGRTRFALPAASGQNSPAGIGAFPFAGITQSSYALCSGSGPKLLAWKISPPRAAR